VSRAEVREKLLAIMKENARIDPEALRDEASLRDDLRMDSLDLVSVVNEVEHEFGVLIPDKELEKLQTVGEVVDALVGLLAAKKA
jgi:acyl carrier protein